MRSDEVVITAQQLQVVLECLLRAGVAWRPPTQVRRPLTNCEVEPLDKRRIQCRRVLGVIEGFIESPRGSNQRSSFDLHDTIIPARLENLAIETSWSKDASDDPLVEIESVGDDQGKTLPIHPVGHVAQESECVPVASTPDDGRGPETGPDFDRDEYPRQPRLAAGEGANFVGLELLDAESGSPSLVEATANVGGFLKPSSDGVPGKPFDARNRRDADALDSESDHCVESRPSMLETVVRRAFGRRERLCAPDAPVSTPFPGSRSVEAVADDVPGTDSSVERTCGIETSSILQFGFALVHERTASLEIGLKL